MSLNTKTGINYFVNQIRAWPGELKKQKERGCKLIGYTGRFVPEELIYAAEAKPYLLCRGGEPEPPEAVLPYMLRIMNPYTRAQIGNHLLGVDPMIPILDLIIAECSDCHMARLADLLEYFKLPTARLGIPPDWKKSLSYDYYHRGLMRIKETIESLTQNSISNEKLKKTTDSINKIRSLLKKIGELRKQQPPPIGGYDFIRLNHYSFYCELGKQIEKLGEFYEQLKTAKSEFLETTPRLLLAGHGVAVGDYVLAKLIETSGGVIVAEFLDEGMRHCQWEVNTDGDLLKNLADMYFLARIPPSLFQPAWEERLAYMKKLINEYNIDGVVWYQLSFDEVYDMEYSIISREMEGIKVPVLKLESSYEYAREAMGPLITRVEGFIELIRKNKEK